MNYIETNVFKKTARRLDAQTRAELVDVLAQIEAAETIDDLPNVKDMKGGKTEASFGFSSVTFGLAFSSLLRMNLSFVKLVHAETFIKPSRKI